MSNHREPRVDLRALAMEYLKETVRYAEADVERLVKTLDRVVAQSRNYVADSEVEPTRVDFAHGRFVEVVGREACLEVGLHAVAAPLFPEGVKIWVGTTKTPDCITCMDRGRVWEGTDGETKPCPDCATFGVWLTSQCGRGALGGVGWAGEPHWMTAHGGRFTRRFADYLVQHPFAHQGWIAEVRRLPDGEKP